MKKEILFFTDNSEIGTPNVPVKNKQFKDGGVENGDYQKVELELSNNSKSNYVPAVKIKALFDYDNEKIKFVGLDTFDNFRMRWIKVQENKSGYFITAKYFGGVVYIDNYLKILSEYKKQTNPKMAEGGLIAPNGEQSFLTPEQYKLVRTPEFKAWFGDWENDPENASKVVYHNGEPMPVYHGTTEEFTTFEEKSYFTDDYMNADGYANGEIVIEAFLIIKNPLIINAKGRKWDDLKSKYGGSTREIVDSLDQEKYDGVIFNSVNDNWFDDEGDPQNVYNVNKPNQIKLADGTNTTFDPTNDDIRFKDGGKIKGVTEVVYEDNGDTILIGSKNNKTRVTVKGLSLEQIKEELEFEKDMLRFKKSSVANFSEDEIRSQRGMTDKEKLDAIKLNKQSLVEIEKVEKIIIPFYESKLNSFEDGGSINNERIVCQKCDWSWKVEDGGDDLYVCHKCGYDNAPYYATKFAGGGGIDINEPFKVNGKTLAERVRILVKQLYPDYKWSITSSYSKMDVYLLEADFDPFTDLFQQENPDRKYYSVDDRDLSDYNRQNNAKITERAVEVFKPIRDYINKFIVNYNANDPYADYSSYNVYEYTYIGKWDKPYKQVEPKAGKKAKAKTPVTPTVASTPAIVEPKFKVGDIVYYRSTGDKKYKVIEFIEFDSEIQENIYRIESLSDKTKGKAKEILMSLVETKPKFNVGDIVYYRSSSRQEKKYKVTNFTGFSDTFQENMYNIEGLEDSSSLATIETQMTLVEPAVPTAEQNTFLDYLKANNEKATLIPRELEVMNALTLFIQSAKEIENLDADRYATLLVNMIEKLTPTT